MNRLSFKGKILFILFAVFLIICDVLFNLEQMILSGISFIGAIVFALLLVLDHKRNIK